MHKHKKEKQTNKKLKTSVWLKIIIKGKRGCYKGGSFLTYV